MNQETKFELPEIGTKGFIDRAIAAIIDGFSGAGTSEKNEWSLSVGHVLQRIRSGQFLLQLKQEWVRYRVLGMIKDDYQSSEQHYTCLQEFMDFFQNDLVNEKRFSVLKRIFLVAASETYVDRDSLLPQEYMRIARKLSDGEIIVLTAEWIRHKEKRATVRNPQNGTASQWFGNIAEESGLRFNELIEISDDELIRKKLFRVHPKEKGKSDPVPYPRFTDLGLDFCAFIDTFEE